MWCDPRDSSLSYGRGSNRARCGFSGETLRDGPVRALRCVLARLFGTTKPHSPKPQRSIPHRPVAPAQGCSEVPSACGAPRSSIAPISAPENPSLRDGTPIGGFMPLTAGAFTAAAPGSASADFHSVAGPHVALATPAGGSVAEIHSHTTWNHLATTPRQKRRAFARHSRSETATKKKQRPLWERTPIRDLAGHCFAVGYRSHRAASVSVA